MKIKSLIADLEKFAPIELVESYDNVGLMVGDVERECSGVLVALDLTDSVIEEAKREGANLIITHHPFIWDPLRTVDLSTLKGRQIAALIESGITVYSAHTNLDKAEGGLNVTLAKMLGGKNIRRDEEGVGVLFDIDATLGELAISVSKKLSDGSVKMVGEKERRVRTVYLVTGSGGSEYDRARALADALVTGELKHHQYVEANDEGFMLIEFSHYHSEIIMQDVIADVLKNSGVKIIKAGSVCPFRRVEEI